MPFDAAQQEILDLTQKVLDSIAEGNWNAYAALCDESLTAFEPEAIGHLISGLEFHKFYFDLSGGSSKAKNTICDADIRVMGDVALISFYRLTQYVGGDGKAGSRGTEETRVWQKKGGKWKHIHFHRSPSRTA